MKDVYFKWVFLSDVVKIKKQVDTCFQAKFKQRYFF